MISPEANKSDIVQDHHWGKGATFDWIKYASRRDYVDLEFM
jgi:hypothetical protein